MLRYLRGVLHPEIYHGFGRKAPYFEGWYYKLVDAARGRRLAVIPGIFKAEGSETGDHSFIQVLDGMSGRASYHQYPAEAFIAHPERLDVRVGNSHFTAEHIRLDIDTLDGRVAGEVRFAERALFPSTLWMPGIMGPFAWIPAMECYHGLVSLDHRLDGTLTVDGAPWDFGGGRGYIEKDWGTNFPSAYVWMQSNHFPTPGTSLSASVAMIPLYGLKFPGFIIAFWHAGTLYRWATYTGAKIEHLSLDDSHVTWRVRGGGHILTLVAERASGGLLKAPIRTEMHKRVDETMQSTVQLKLETTGGDVILDALGDCTALEVHGEIEKLVTA
ncbi:MAG: hypothetical protein MUF38_09430 [Anaerolineae bacterium]|jgi:hypothetical protein|nr:hypothetical protein [Anaerolineae bacterium]